MLINIQDKYKEIEQHIITNQKIFLICIIIILRNGEVTALMILMWVYFCGDGNIPTVQIFVRNKTGYIKSHVLLNKTEIQL